MLISRLPSGKWILGHHNDSVFVCDAPSINTARMRYLRSGGTSSAAKRPDIEPGFYVIPNEFTPVSRASAQCHGTRYYVGSSCRHHPLNHIRSTANKTCVVCEILKDYL